MALRGTWLVEDLSRVRTARIEEGRGGGQRPLDRADTYTSPGGGGMGEGRACWVNKTFGG
jgi:hypothetical protein